MGTVCIDGLHLEGRSVGDCRVGVFFGVCCITHLRNFTILRRAGNMLLFISPSSARHVYANIKGSGRSDGVHLDANDCRFILAVAGLVPCYCGCSRHVAATCFVLHSIVFGFHCRTISRCRLLSAIWYCLIRYPCTDWLFRHRCRDLVPICFLLSPLPRKKYLLIVFGAVLTRRFIFRSPYTVSWGVNDPVPLEIQRCLSGALWSAKTNGDCACAVHSVFGGASEAREPFCPTAHAVAESA